MPIITPTVSTLSSPIISVNTTASSALGVTYEQILQSLGAFNYQVRYLYLAATTFPEIFQEILYNHFDANGNSISTFLVFAVDEYQYLPTFIYKVPSDDIILTSLSSLSLKVFPNKTVNFQVYSNENSVQDIYGDGSTGYNAFQNLEDIEGVSFFDNYTNYLIDND